VVVVVVEEVVLALLAVAKVVVAKVAVAAKGGKEGVGGVHPMIEFSSSTRKRRGASYCSLFGNALSDNHGSWLYGRQNRLPLCMPLWSLPMARWLGLKKDAPLYHGNFGGTGAREVPELRWPWVQTARFPRPIPLK
jgi:hypothetical protein